jgi:hypothetical protein
VDALRSNDLNSSQSLMIPGYDHEEGTQEEWNPMALASAANAEDNLTWE